MGDRTEELTKFLASLQHRSPTVHDELTRHVLKGRGWKCGSSEHDTQLLRLVSLAAQRFVASVAHDALEMHRQRRRQTQAKLREQGLKDARPVLALEDLAAALQEYGVNLKPAAYFLDAGAAKQA